MRLKVNFAGPEPRRDFGCLAEIGELDNSVGERGEIRGGSVCVFRGGPYPKVCLAGGVSVDERIDGRRTYSHGFTLRVGLGAVDLVGGGSGTRIPRGRLCLYGALGRRCARSEPAGGHGGRRLRSRTRSCDGGGRALTCSISRDRPLAVDVGVGVAGVLCGVCARGGRCAEGGECAGA